MSRDTFIDAIGLADEINAENLAMLDRETEARLQEAHQIPLLMHSTLY